MSSEHEKAAQLSISSRAGGRVAVGLLGRHALGEVAQLIYVEAEHPFIKSL